jgi:hypothetical protein
MGDDGQLYRLMSDNCIGAIKPSGESEQILGA